MPYPELDNANRRETSEPVGAGEAELSFRTPINTKIEYINRRGDFLISAPIA